LASDHEKHSSELVSGVRVQRHRRADRGGCLVSADGIVHQPDLGECSNDTQFGFGDRQRAPPSADSLVTVLRYVEPRNVEPWRRHEMSIDPVCKMQVNEAKAAGTSEYHGKTYYFCAVSCKR